MSVLSTISAFFALVEVDSATALRCVEAAIESHREQVRRPE